MGRSLFRLRKQVRHVAGVVKVQRQPRVFYNLNRRSGVFGFANVRGKAIWTKMGWEQVWWCAQNCIGSRPVPRRRQDRARSFEGCRKQGGDVLRSHPRKVRGEPEHCLDSHLFQLPRCRVDGDAFGNLPVLPNKRPSQRFSALRGARGACDEKNRNRKGPQGTNEILQQHPCDQRPFVRS